MKAIDHQERSSLKNMMIQEIKQYIVDHQLKAGDRFPTERKLMELYGVSRSVVREALSYLENTGVIRTKQGQGAFLNETNMSHLLENFFFLWEINGGNIAEIQSLRLIFESAAIDEISKENSDLTILKEAIKKGATAETMEACRDADKAFHVALLEETGNKLFIQMSHIITQYFFASAHIHLSPEEYEQMLEEHQKILNAIEVHDAEEAKSILTQHIRKIKN